jgi:hypothetical protein
VIHLLHHHRDQRLGDVDVILDASFSGLNVAESSSPIFAAAKNAKKRIAVIQRQFGGTTHLSYAPASEEQVTMALIASLTAMLGVPLDAPAAPVNAEYDRC